MRRLIILLLLLITFSITQAQTDTPNDTWGIVERCIDEPTLPPADWSYDGIVFMYSDRAVHGLNANIPTPYIVANSNRNRVFAFSGALSPNGEWFAVPEGRGRPAGLIVWHYEITRITTYSTDARQIKQSIGLDIPIRIGSDLYISDVDQPQWLNDEEFLYPVGAMSNIYDEIHIYNPFTGEEASYTGEYQSQALYLTNWMSREDERWLITEQTFNLISRVMENPNNAEFAVFTRTTFYTSQTDSRTFINHCLPITGIAFSSSGEIVVSTGEEILLIEGENVYRLAYHDGTVFDWRFPDNQMEG